MNNEAVNGGALNVTFDPGVIQMLGSKMYSLPPTVVIPRELVQNSKDAAVRRGVEPDIHVELNVYDKKVEITVSDNGDGMTVDDILGKFLRVGRRKTATEQKGGVGGFGLAKIAIMSQKWFAVHTLSNYFDFDSLSEGGQIEKVEPREGTMINVTVERPNWNNWNRSEDIYETLGVLALSEVKTRVSIHVHLDNETDSKTQTLNGMDVTLGCNQKPFQVNGQEIVHKTHEVGSKYEATIFDTFKIGDFEYKGYSFYKVGGLTQFFTHSNNRENNVEVVLQDGDPQGDDYILTTNRESISDDDTRQKVNDMLNKMIADSGSTIKKMRYTPPPRSRNYLQDGELIGGNGKYEHNRHSVSEIAKAMSASNIKDLLAVASKKQPSEDGNIVIGQRQSATGIATIFTDYEEPYGKRRECHVRILEVWTAMVSITAQDFVGTGLTGRDYQIASRVRQNSDYFHVVNPDKIIDMVLNNDGMNHHGFLAMLWHMAVHEASHMKRDFHDEVFCTEEVRIAAATASDFYTASQKMKSKVPGLLNYIRNLDD